MVNQAQQGSGDPEGPVNDPHAKYILLLLIQNAFQSGQDGGTRHEQEAEMDVQARKNQGGEQNCPKPGISAYRDAFQIALDDTAEGIPESPPSIKSIKLTCRILLIDSSRFRYRSFRSCLSLSASEKYALPSFALWEWKQEEGLRPPCGSE